MSLQVWIVTKCQGAIETENYSKTEMGKDMLKLSLKAEEKESKETKNKKEVDNDSSQDLALNAKKDRYKSSNLVDISA